MDCLLCAGPLDLAAPCQHCGARYYVPRDDDQYAAIAYTYYGSFGDVVKKYPARRFADLPAHQRKQLARLLEASDFANMPESLPPLEVKDAGSSILAVTYADGTTHSVGGESIGPRKDYPVWHELVGYVRKIFEK